MRNLTGILIAVVLVVLGLGVVRPRTARYIDEAWEPVVQARIEAPLTGGNLIELSTPGEYLIFIDGPADNPLWDSATEQWIQLLDAGHGRPMPGGAHGADFSYEHDGRRAVSLARVSALPGDYELEVREGASAELHAAGFRVLVSPADLVTKQSRQATIGLAVGCAAGVLMGIIALSMLLRRPA
jgi:hypothetical protein